MNFFVGVPFEVAAGGSTSCASPLDVNTRGIFTLILLLLALSLGLPLVLLQRIVSSLSTGKNAELEMICLALSIIVMGCVSMTYNALRGNKCGILWCEGNKNI